jgi:hypothetical protein
VLVDVCAALSGNQPEEAAAILRERYPFVPLVKAGRRYSMGQMLRVFVRDGFVDRYSGTRLVCIAALRLISMRLPSQFPFQTNCARMFVISLSWRRRRRSAVALRRPHLDRTQLGRRLRQPFVEACERFAVR